MKNHKITSVLIFFLVVIYYLIFVWIYAVPLKRGSVMAAHYLGSTALGVIAALTYYYTRKENL